MTIKRVWDIKQSEITDEIYSAACSSSVLAKLLANRGINTKEKIDKFLNPMTIPMNSPDSFCDMEKASERVKTAVENGENITVYGDFDADGITSTSILYLTLKHIGANVDYYIPDRALESHGLNNKALVNIISKRKTKLIITVDCGISNTSEVNLAKGLRCDVIITDHHEAPETLPSAYAILNPKAQNSLVQDLTCEELESMNYLSGAGVAFKFACKLLEMFKKEEYVHVILPLAAVGTIGDVVELLGENRRLVEMGLELIKSGRHKGIQSLLNSAGVLDTSAITSDTIAYYIVPRINAAGRLESPDTALNILISDDVNLIENNVKLLNDYNKLRQELCEQTFIQAQEMYENNLADNKKSIVLFHDDWHIGVIGIVCSKLTEYYNKPSFLMTRDSNNSNIIRCSCRSIEGINIHAVLSEHKEVFEGFGGHKMAAGFSFDENKIKFETFKQKLNKTIDEYSQNIDFNTVRIPADMLLEPDDITINNIELMNKMQPFGAANPAPVFVMNNLKIDSIKMIGQNNNHLKMIVSKNGSLPFECIKWNCTDLNINPEKTIDILFEPHLHTFNGNTSIRLMLNDIHFEMPAQTEIKILDHRNKKNILMQVLDFISSTKKTTAIFVQDSALKKQLDFKDKEEKIFDSKNIPGHIEQLMFFECPYNSNDFCKILKETDAKIIHLMNFNITETTTDNIISKLSGMIKYAIANMNGQLDLNRLSGALNIDTDTIECAITLFEDCRMIEMNKPAEDKYIIESLTPVEMSKLKQDDLYTELDERINNINNFRKFYLNSSIEDIKKTLLAV